MNVSLLVREPPRPSLFAPESTVEVLDLTVLRIQNGQIKDFNYVYRVLVTAVPGAAATPKEGRWCCSSLPAGARLGMAVATGTEVMLRHEKSPAARGATGLSVDSCC